ncbi:hypothetical protein SAMN04490244_103144, partial [Tranquillimonas rosea]
SGDGSQSGDQSDQQSSGSEQSGEQSSDGSDDGAQAGEQEGQQSGEQSSGSDDAQQSSEGSEGREEVQDTEGDGSVIEGNASTTPETEGDTSGESSAQNDGAVLPIQPGDYAQGTLVASFAPDGSFAMSGGDRISDITGSYSFEGDNMLVLEDASGQGPTDAFPLECEITPTGRGFNVMGPNDGCGPLSGLVFERAVEGQ